MYITLEEEAIIKKIELLHHLWTTKLLQDAFVARMQSFTGCEGEYDA